MHTPKNAVWLACAFLWVIQNPLAGLSETSPGDALTVCAVAGRIFEPISVIHDFQIEVIGKRTSFRQKQKLVDGSFQFAAVPAGRYEFRIFSREGKVLLKRTEELKGTGDFVRLRLPASQSDDRGIVSVHQLSHHVNRNALKIFRRGMDALETADLAGAVTLLETAASLDPQFPEAHLDLITPYLNLNRPDKAVQHARAAFEIDPEQFETGYDLAATLIDVHSYQEAENVLQKLSLYETSKKYDVEILRALILFGQKSIPEAIEHLNRVLDDMPAARLMAVDVLVGTGQIAAAVDQARQYLRSSATECERPLLEAWLEKATKTESKITAPH